MSWESFDSGKPPRGHWMGEVMWPAPDRKGRQGEGPLALASDQTSNPEVWMHRSWGSTAGVWAQGTSSVWVQLLPLHNACKCWLHMKDSWLIPKWSKHGNHLFAVGVKRKEKNRKQKNRRSSKPLPETQAWSLPGDLINALHQPFNASETNRCPYERRLLYCSSSTHTELTLMSILTRKPRLSENIRPKEHGDKFASFKRNSPRLKR